VREINLRPYVANRLVDKTVEGDMQAIKELLDRVDGKSGASTTAEETPPPRSWYRFQADANALTALAVLVLRRWAASSLSDENPAGPAKGPAGFRPPLGRPD
jgi:hypothetical protein